MVFKKKSLGAANGNVEVAFEGGTRLYTVQDAAERGEGVTPLDLANEFISKSPNTRSIVSAPVPADEEADEE